MKIPSYQGVKASSLSVSKSHLDVTLEDGRMLRIPTSLFPKLQNATPPQLAHWEWIGEGIGIEWPELDEHLSIAGFLKNTPYFVPKSPAQNPRPAAQCPRSAE
jgi:hypothetical protein